MIEFWRTCDEALHDISSWPYQKEPYYLDKNKALLVTSRGIKLPNGLYIQYPGLTYDTSEAKSRFTYKSRRGTISVWGGSVVENVIQALARIIVGEQMIEINDKYRPVLTVHDAVVCVAKKDDADKAKDFIMEVMSKPPKWAVGLPVACEANYGESYGDC